MVRMSVLAAALGVFFISGCAAPETAPPAPEAQIGLSENWPDTSSAAVSPSFTPDGIDALEAVMRRYVEDGHVKGISTLLVQGGEVVSHVNAGIRRQSDGAPVTDDTLFRIYSMTKPVTSVAMLMLHEEGAFELDDPITTVFPEFEGLTVIDGDTTRPVSRAPTFAELLSHQAGFAYGLGGEDVANTAFREGGVLRSPDLETFIDAVAAIPLLHEPGTSWYYSAATDIQGAAVERLSGQSFGDFLDARIFTPLAMNDTAFFVPTADYDRFSDVWGYDTYSGELVPMPYPWAMFLENTIAMESGGGGLVSTTGDYARFLQMLLGDGALGDVRILSPQSVALLTTNVLPEGQGIFSDGSTGRDLTGVGFGLGVGTFDGPPATDRGYGAGSSFWGGAAGTWYWMDPENDLFFIGMIQRFPAGGPDVDFRADSARLVYDAMAGDE